MQEESSAQALATSGVARRLACMVTAPVTVSIVTAVITTFMAHRPQGLGCSQLLSPKGRLSLRNLHRAGLRVSVSRKSGEDSKADS